MNTCNSFVERAAACVSSKNFGIFVFILLFLTIGGRACFAESRIVPPSEWSDLPTWSPDGSKIAVRWPAPAIILPNGTLDREVSTKKAAVISQLNPETLSSTANPPMRVYENVLDERTLFLDSRTFERLPFEIPGFSFQGAWSPNGKLFASESMQLLSIFDISTGHKLLQLPIRSRGLTRIAWSADSKSIAIGQMSGVQVWKLGTKLPIFSIPDLSGECCSLVWSPDGKSIAACSDYAKDDSETALRVVDIDTGKVRFSLNLKGRGTEVAWSHDGKWFAYNDTSVHVLVSESMKQSVELKPDGLPLKSSFTWSPTESRIAFKGISAKLNIFDVNQMVNISEIPAEKTGRYSFKWSPNGKFILLDDFNNQLAICEADSGRYIGSKAVEHATRTAWWPGGEKLVVYSLASRSVKVLPLTFSPNAIAFEGGKEGNPWKDQKVLQNIDDCIQELKRILPPEILEGIKTTAESELYRYTGGPSLAMTIRNTWGLNGYNPLVQYFNDRGIRGSRSMSDIVILCLRRQLNGLPIKFDDAVASYKESEAFDCPVIEEKRAVPERFLNLESNTADGERFSVGKMQGTSKLVALIETRYAYSQFLLESLLEIRRRFAEDKVSIAVFAFTPQDVGKLDHDSNEIKKALAACNRFGIPIVYGSTEFRETFNEFVGGRTPRLPQLLVVDSDGKASIRFNGWSSSDDLTKFLVKAITKP